MRPAIAKDTFEHPVRMGVYITYMKNNFYEVVDIQPTYYTVKNNNYYTYFNLEEFTNKFDLIGLSGYEK